MDHHRPPASRLAIARSLAAIGAPVVLAACAPAAISSVELDPAQRVVCDTAVIPQVCGVLDSQPVLLRVHGKGNCSAVFTTCGNGSVGTPDGMAHDFGQLPAEQPLAVACNYGGSFLGPKTVRVHSNGSDCIGEASLPINVVTPRGIGGQVDYRQIIGFQPGPTDCGVLPNHRPLRAGTKVKVQTDPNPNLRINFGCFNPPGCIYDADGEPNSSAPHGFPFEGLRKYSLVLQVGPDPYQGGTDTGFTVKNAGLLEICINDDDLGRNSGAWAIFMVVDESQLP